MSAPIYQNKMYRLVKSHEMDSLLKLTFSIPNGLFTYYSIKFPTAYSICPTVADISPSVADISPTVADISPTVADIPPTVADIHSLLRTFPRLLRTFPPLLQTQSIQSLFWDMCNQLQSFDIQSCCMMSGYNNIITQYNQLIMDIFKIMQ